MGCDFPESHSHSPWKLTGVALIVMDALDLEFSARGLFPSFMLRSVDEHFFLSLLQFRSYCVPAAFERLAS